MKMFNETELKRLSDFHDKHSKCYSKYKKSAKFKITLTATGIGDNVEVKCCSCKKSKDISDYDNW